MKNLKIQSTLYKYNMESVKIYDKLNRYINQSLSKVVLQYLYHEKDTGRCVVNIYYDIRMHSINEYIVIDNRIEEYLDKHDFTAETWIGEYSSEIIYSEVLHKVFKDPSDVNLLIKNDIAVEIDQSCLFGLEDEMDQSCLFGLEDDVL
jgi:hypothetical protein